MRGPITLLLAVVFFSPPVSAKNPWEELMGRKPRLWRDKQGRFSLDLPVGWTPQTSAESPVVYFHRSKRQQATVSVDVRNLPAGVRATHLNAHIQDENKSHAKGYKLVEQQVHTVGGTKAVQSIITYRALGSVRHYREIVQNVLVVGERGFVITLEMPLGTRGIFWEEFELMLKGFSVGRESIVRQPRSRKSRRRVRAGEMINPDAIGY